MIVEEVLKSSGIERLDAEVLLAFAIGKSREWLFAHPESEVDATEFTHLIERRKNNEPVAYIVENQEFYGRDFFVDSRVLIPRSSTERLIDLTLDFLKEKEDCIRSLDTKVIGVTRAFGDIAEISTLVDVCTGSGCIAITLALETDKRIIATDISSKALDVAKKNAAKMGIEDRIDFRLGDLTNPIADIEESFVVVSNPPYIPEGEPLMPDVSEHEPSLALFGGKDGSEPVVKIYNSLKLLPNCKGCVLECRDTHAVLLL
jgi:release factor glutamine methyltransferase